MKYAYAISNHAYGDWLLRHYDSANSQLRTDTLPQGAAGTLSST
jgi:hypothetical protein